MIESIKSIKILSMANFMGVSFAIIGLIDGIIFAIMGSIMGSMISAMTTSIPIEGAQVSSELFELGWLMVIIFPVAFGFMGFVMGALSAIFYNVISKITGGIKVDLQVPVSQRPVQYQKRYVPYSYQKYKPVQSKSTTPPK